MRLLVTTLTVTTLMLGCQKQREQVEKFVFDSKQIASRQTHKYDFYPDGKIKTDNSETIYYMAGIPIDTITYKEIYTYNSSGKIESIFDETYSTRQIKIYNQSDSLIGDFRINEYGDTTFLETKVYEDNRIVKEVYRMLSALPIEDFDNIKQEDLRKYDTLLYILEITYKGNVREKTITKDKHGNVTAESDDIYENGKRVTTITYSFIGDAKFIRQTTNYRQTEFGEPDFITIGIQGDTIMYQETSIQDDVKVVTNYFGQTKHQSFWYYDNNGRLIGTIEIDLTNNIKDVNSFKYDKNGNVIEEANYKERINYAR